MIKSSRLTTLYVVLIGLNIIAISAILYLNYSLLRDFRNNLELNASASKFLSQSGDIIELASNLNSKTGNVFRDCKNVSQDKEVLENASKLETEIKKNREMLKIIHRMQVSQEDAGNVENLADNNEKEYVIISNKLKEMISLCNSNQIIFVQKELKESQTAHSNLVGNVTKIQNMVRAIRGSYLKKEVAGSDKVQVFMFIIAFIFLIIVMGLSFFGYRNSKQMHDAYIIIEDREKKLLAAKEETDRILLELQNTLGQVQKLKLQQDGDYFLTTLLIHPLIVNEATGAKIKIDFLIRQKKTFEFKGKIYEIGGDICIVNNIQLRGKNYSVFINGDAMGKSIQGAGGALVLGVVFRAIIERTRNFAPNANLHPERWLKNCFIELQNVFTSFDGSMLVSVVMGLVEENSGMLFFLNAEHPWVVLYRDNKAQFIENELFLHKIGMLGLDKGVRIQIFHMLPGDSIIIGSDGKDDILLEVSETGMKNINEDEKLFLKHVENGNGELPEITNEILKQGEFSDDYSLMKLSYLERNETPKIQNPKFIQLLQEAKLSLKNEDYENTIQLYKNALELEKEEEVFQSLLRICYSLKNYKEFIPLCEDYLAWNPMNSEYYLKLSLAYKITGNFIFAADYGECLKLREPENIKNILNLADIYRKQENLPRASKLLADARGIEPNHKSIKKLESLLNQN